ncbi:unnamed protein product [Symbiodinium natans]|uniref:CCHC-type domain-containing protein n=1 Tax=Symbiodinium natans TaxID=878477 RepID=A0A812I351_9DINO|nr:unnamed protein product [Symbiodinium natans]
MPFEQDGGASAIPTWDGHPKGWRRYAREVAWYVQGTKHNQRRYLATRLISRLTGSARLLAMSWHQDEFDGDQGVLTYVRKLASSPLVRRSLPNAAAIMNQYFQFKRNPGEPITTFLVRETLGFEEFQEALLRLRDERQGLSVDKQLFGLESLLRKEGGEDNSEAPGDDEGTDSNARGKPEATPPGSQTGSSPHHRPSGAAESTQKQPQGDSPVPQPEPTPRSPAGAAAVFVQAEEDTYDSFILDVLRGWRLLQAASLSLDERRDVLSATRNRLDFESISNALQVLWDEQLSGARRMAPTSPHHHQSYVMEQQGWDEDAMFPGWHETKEDDPWADWHGYHVEERWPEGDVMAQENMEELTASELEDPAVREALQAERAAELMASEAAMTWKRAQRATSELRKDRGFGKGMSAAVVSPGGKGNTVCFKCGRAGHMARDCTVVRGKGKQSFYIGEDWDYDYYDYDNFAIQKGKGKKGTFGKSHFGLSKGWKGRGKTPFRSSVPGVNAYGLEMLGAADQGLTLDFNVATRGDAVSPNCGLVDSGATASAGPEASVQCLINAVLERDRSATIKVDQSRRPYFRYGSGSWGRAQFHAEISSSLSGSTKSFGVYALPNPPEYVEKWFRDDMDDHDFNDGFFINATDKANLSEPKSEQYLTQTSKGHFAIDIVDYLTGGKACSEGHCHVVAQVHPPTPSIALPGTDQDLPLQYMYPLEIMSEELMVSDKIPTMSAAERHTLIVQRGQRSRSADGQQHLGSRMRLASPLPNSDNIPSKNIVAHAAQSREEASAPLGREQDNPSRSIDLFPFNTNSFLNTNCISA